MNGLLHKVSLGRQVTERGPFAVKFQSFSAISWNSVPAEIDAS